MSFASFVDRRIARETESLGDLFMRTISSEAGAVSETLARTFLKGPVITSGGVRRVRVRSPFFWSSILDQGRGPISKSSGFLVYFRNPLQDDPRLQGGYHRTLTQARAARLRISAEEFSRLREDGSLIARRSVGPVQPSNFVARSKRRFRSEGKERFKSTARSAILNELRKLSGEYSFTARIG